MLWALILATPLGLYALHRLALHLEAKGYLYYKHKKPSAGVASCFVAVQRMIEPAVEHVETVARHTIHEHGEADEATPPIRIRPPDHA